MPIVKSKFSPFIRFGHFQTMVPSLVRKVKFISPEKITITTPDNDFLELDLYKQNSRNLVFISHGLEGNTNRAYVKGMARHFYENGYDILAWNYRTCGSKLNNQFRLYHSGDTDDIHTVLTYIHQNLDYDSISLIGFSMGGNVTLKYLGEQSYQLYSNITSAVVFSVPMDLAGSSLKLAMPNNKFYMARFLRKLTKKVKLKAAQFPDKISLENIDKLRSFKEFDDLYTAPIHGFKNAEDYWKLSSSLHLLGNISIPTLIIQAKNDSFLSPTCFPYELAKNSKNIYLETPESGGHVGFWSISKTYWSERRALEFVREIISS